MFGPAYSASVTVTSFSVKYSLDSIVKSLEAATFLISTSLPVERSVAVPAAL